MITVRHYGASDLSAVEALHAKQALAYALPNLDADTMLVRTVVENGNGVTHAAFLRKTAEAYWIFDPATTMHSKTKALLVLHAELTKLAKQVGFEDVHCWLPLEIAAKFEATLFKLGWERPLWTCYRREVR